VNRAPVRTVQRQPEQIIIDRLFLQRADDRLSVVGSRSQGRIQIGPYRRITPAWNAVGDCLCCRSLNLAAQARLASFRSQ